MKSLTYKLFIIFLFIQSEVCLCFAQFNNPHQFNSPHGPLYFEQPLKQNDQPQNPTASSIIILPYPIITLDKNEPLYDATLKQAYKEVLKLKPLYINAFGEFNNKKQFTIVPRFMPPSSMDLFYEDLVSQREEAKKHNKDFKIIDFTKGHLKDIQEIYKDSSISAIIWGVYICDPDATYGKITVFYYDITKDAFYKQSSIIIKNEGRERQRQVNDLFYRLLEKVYH